MTDLSQVPTKELLAEVMRITIDRKHNIRFGLCGPCKQDDGKYFCSISTDGTGQTTVRYGDTLEQLILESCELVLQEGAEDHVRQRCNEEGHRPLPAWPETYCKYCFMPLTFTDYFTFRVDRGRRVDD